jgi:hypothetical protein
VKRAPWSADNGLAATDSRLRSVDIRHLSVAHGLLSMDSRPAAADNRRMSAGISPMSVDNGRKSVDIALMFAASHPLSSAESAVGRGSDSLSQGGSYGKALSQNRVRHRQARWAGDRRAHQRGGGLPRSAGLPRGTPGEVGRVEGRSPVRPDRERDKLLREARTATKLSHPNIVFIHAVEQAGEFVFFIGNIVSRFDPLPTRVQIAWPPHPPNRTLEPWDHRALGPQSPGTTEPWDHRRAITWLTCH